jgi:hypothetical protein
MPFPNFSMVQWLQNEGPPVLIVVHLVQNSVDTTVMLSLSSMALANYPGYFSQGLSVIPESVKVAASSGQTIASFKTKVMSWEYQGVPGAQPNTIYGFITVAIYPDASEQLVTYTAFDAPIVVDGVALPLAFDIAMECVLQS